MMLFYNKNKTKMKLIKYLLWALAIVIIPLSTIVVGDDCFDTVIDKDWKVYYIDPSDEYSIFEDRESLVRIYWDKIKCNWDKKVYSSEEYTNKIYNDLYKQMQKQEKGSSWISTLIELILSILWCVAMRKIFVKAWKPGINSIIPIYNFYELTDIAWLQWMFSKAFLCWLIWVILYFFVPILWIILILLCALYWCFVNFYVARNFGRSTIASLLYVVFNPIAILILAFWNDKYYLVEQKEKIKEINRKVLLEEDFSPKSWENKDPIMDWLNWNINVNNCPKNNSQPEENPIKYIDSSKFA